MAVTVSPDYRVVIPAKVRHSLGIKPGQKFEMIEFEGCLDLVPVKNIKSLRGSLKGIRAQVDRERRERA